MKILIKDISNKEEICKQTDGITWIDCDKFETNTQIFFPDEIAIEVSCNFSSGDGEEVWNLSDIRHDIECYFTDYIENILDKTIEIIEDYGDTVK